MDESLVIEGVYALREKIAEGGMAVIYRADVDLEAFDYTRLYAYTQVQGKTHAERQQQAARLSQTLSGEALDRNTVRAILKAHNIPLPPPVVVVKVAKSNMDPARFEAEWQNLLCLSHPNVIKVYGGGAWMNRHFYAMEFLEGLVDIEEVAKTLPLEDKLKIIVQAGKGLAFLHENGIVHRDVKPDNFLTCRTPDGQFMTKITDLGIAKTMDGSPGLTQTSQFMGTPYYMAPEQVRSARDVDARADVYSLGASIYDLVLGVPPFHDKTTLFEIVACISRGEMPIPPKQHNPALPDVLNSIIQCSMAPERDARYPTMADLVTDLETYIAMASPELLASKHIESFPAQELVSGGYDVSIYRFDSVTRGSAPAQAMPTTVPPHQVPPTSSGAPAAPMAPTQRSSLGLWVAILGGLGALFLLAVVAAFAVSWFTNDAPSPPPPPDSSGSSDTDARGPLDVLSGLTGDSKTKRNIPEVHLNAMKTNQGWMLNLQLRDYQIKEILYRVGETGNFQSTGHSTAMNMQTGFPMPNVTISLPLSQPRSDIYVKLIDPDDNVRGPYKLLFDPGSEAVAMTKQVLNMTASSWVSFRDMGGRRLLYFTHLLSYRDGLREIRYSLDSPSLDQRLPMGGSDPYANAYIEVPPQTRTAYVQVVYNDNTESEVRQFQAP